MAIKYAPAGAPVEVGPARTKAAAEEVLRRLPPIVPASAVTIKIRLTPGEVRALDDARGLLPRQDWIRLKIGGGNV